MARLAGKVAESQGARKTAIEGWQSKTQGLQHPWPS